MMPARGRCPVWLAVCWIATTWSTAGAVAADSGDTNLAANGDFRQGKDAPEGWSLSGGQGTWIGRDVLEVIGGGEDSNFWRCDCPLQPGRLYHFQMRARRVGGNGSAVSGPASVNRDHRLGDQWRWVGHAFRVPDNATDAYLRLGQWHATGRLQFDSVRVVPTIPVHQEIAGLRLGEGESIRDNRYTFSGTFGHAGSNYHRTLQGATAGFNSDRWTFGGDQQVTYRFALPGRKYTWATASFNVNYHIRGGCLLEVSRDGKTWQSLAKQEEVGTALVTLPDDLLPAETLYLRLSAMPGGSSFQVNRVELTADVDGEPLEATGETVFADVNSARGQMIVDDITMVRAAGAAQGRLHVTVKNPGRQAATASLRSTIASDDGSAAEGALQRAELATGNSHAFSVDLGAGRPGEHRLAIMASVADQGTVETQVSFTVPDYYRADYGQRIAGVDGPTAVWWCDAAHKIAPQRRAPTTASPAARLSACRRDFEAVQIVVRPEKPLAGLTASASALTGPDGATIAAENVDILRVAYHYVHHATDSTGVRDWWPDALPPIKQPIDVPADKNQPLWVLVRVPDDARAGDYRGTVSLKADGFSAEVPLALHVWDFALPERNHIETAFGFSPGNVYRYHQLTTEADKRRVLDMYLQCFADHRISPYNPTPMESIGVKFVPEADPPRAELDFAAFDRAMARAVEKFNFTGIRMPIQGMGGGTFHGRHEPAIGRFGEGTPEYEAMFSSYVKQLEAHLREKGWLDMAYIYWFDEPAPKDYEFVINGMKRLHRYAPGLRRMLTEEPGDALAGSVDIWCPVSHNYEHEPAQRRRAHGERFWWYVCTGPKAPYCTLFLDHPAVELRTWLWQTWQRDITGILVWQSNYWTSSAAFPEAPQDPYEDPMGYVSGYSTPRGTKRYWGNGDGRFIYPPEAAAVPGKSGAGPVIEPPVSSIRWEMLREGIEDYEYLYLLRELLAKRRDGLSPEQVAKYEALLEVPKSITRDMTTFSTDPAPIHARRAEIARAIERLRP